MEFRDVVRRRRSVRAYQRDIPPREMLDELVDVARRAPTAGFSQGIDFLVLDDPVVVAEFYDITDPPDADIPDEFRDHRPPVVVLVFSDPNRYLARYAEGDKARFGLADADAWPVRFWDVDAAMAAMQLQLAAVDAGLDTWFFGFNHGEADLRARLGIPDDRSLIGVVGLGYRLDGERPIGSATTRRRRPLGEQLHVNRW
jgi:nitroreductase